MVRLRPLLHPASCDSCYRREHPKINHLLRYVVYSVTQCSRSGLERYYSSLEESNSWWNLCPLVRIYKKRTHILLLNINFRYLRCHGDRSHLEGSVWSWCRNRTLVPPCQGFLSRESRRDWRIFLPTSLGYICLSLVLYTKVQSNHVWSVLTGY